MKRNVLVLLLITLPLMLTACATGPTPEQMIAEAKALDQRFVEAYNKGDVDAILATYWNSPELVSYPPDVMEVRGWQAARQGMSEAVASLQGVTLEVLESNYKVAGDMVISWGKWRMSMPTPLGTTAELVGRYTDVKAMRDGKWVYILEHTSVPLPPPPDHEPAP